MLMSDPDDYYEGSPGMWAAAVALLTVASALLLALGVATAAIAKRGRRPSAGSMPRPHH